MGDNVVNDTYLFADDATNVLISNDLRHFQVHIQTDISNILSWGHKWAVTFSIAKTEYMIISRRENRSQLQLQLGNSQIDEAITHKHLGLFMNNKGTWHEHIIYIIKKANLRLGILKKLKYTCDRATLLKLYVSYIRSILEYGDIVWDNISVELEDRLERVQVDALRCITGLTISSSRAALYAETGILPLNKRRKIHRLVMFYRILNGLAPTSLTALVPNNNEQPRPYPTRNNLLTPFRCRTESFNKSFFPNTTRDWNALPAPIRVKPSVLTFKTALLKTNDFRIDKTPDWYNEGPRLENILLTRIRHSCSGLAQHLFAINVIDSPICQNCGLNEIESPDHFLLNCPKYVNSRNAMLANVRFVFQGHITSNLLLRGNQNLNRDTNKLILKAVCNFIKSTSRFT